MEGRLHLPGGDLVSKGIEHLRQGKVSPESLLVSIGAFRLGSAGVEIPDPIPDAPHRLYALLASEFGNDAHSKYNSLVRRLVSFEQALECGS